ncbi:MAG TPA: transcriptional regulator MntR [Firmicutes bacterium]|nr:transcriptional regulator MntR [Bacillota bacterium]
MLTESMEDYLEMIYRMIRERGSLRMVELAEALDVQPSSITRMIQKIDEAGLVRYEKYRNIVLTHRGEEIGRFLVWRDRMLKAFLRALGAARGVDVDGQVEGIEHYITPATMCLIRNLVDYLHDNPERALELRVMASGGGSLKYPDGIELAELRAWNYRHVRDDG